MKRYLILIFGGLYMFSGCGGGPSGPPPTPPNLQLSPSSLSFGVELIGAETAMQAVTLTNIGGSELAINNVAITGTNAADFNLSSACGSSLGAGASCAINVTFRPSQMGQRSASMTISGNGTDGPQTLSLNGDGGESGANATLSATSLIFGDQETGTTSPAQGVRLSNYGTATLSITSITASTNFGETNNCIPTLASGASCTLNVTFAPSQTGDLTGTLSVADSAADSAQTVSLSGTGFTGKSCQPQGAPCYAGHNCCSGLVCTFEGDRSKCEPPPSYMLRDP
jgi:hypothetical protein